MRQTCHNKGRPGAESAGADEPYEHRFEFDNTKLKQLPIPANQPSQLPTALVKYSTAMQGQSPAATLAGWDSSGPLGERLASARDLAASHRRKLIAWQEELDWQIYEAFGLVESADRVSLPEGEAMDAIPPDGLELGERAFEIVLAQRMAAGEVQTTWFERHKDSGSTPITELPRHWPAAYRELVERRLRCIADDPNIRLIEQPEYKRRWNTEPWDEQFRKAARDWLLGRLEGYFFEGQRVCELKDGFSAAAHGFSAAVQPALVSTNQLAAVVETDKAFLTLAELYTGTPAFSVSKLVRELVEEESVPFLPCQRYKESGVRKRQDWEHVWDLQREEDRIDAESIRLTAAIEKRISELVNRERQEVVKAAAAAQEALDKAERAFHEKHYPGKPYNPDHPYWTLDSIPPEHLSDVLRLQGMAELQRKAKHQVAVARAELAEKDEITIDFQKQLEALKKPAVPVPPKYASSDFKKPNWWKLRGKLDVPKERWVLYPGAERESDPSPVIAWAGWDHAQQAQALAAYYIDANQNQGWSAERLRPLLAGLAELLPWLKQWHNEFNPDYSSGLGDYFAGFLDEEARKQGTTVKALDLTRIAPV